MISRFCIGAVRYPVVFWFAVAGISGGADHDDAMSHPVLVARDGVRLHAGARILSLRECFG